MNIKIYNTLTKKKEIFKPLKEKTVSMYVCGMTVYDNAHLGHARAYSAFDIIHRLFKHLGYKVNYVRNITDIDDKIIKRAREEIKDYDQNPIKACKQLAEKYTASFDSDMKALNLLSPTIEPKATDHMAEIIEIISSLIEKGNAYESGNDVFFKVKSFHDYGKLSGRNIEDIETVSRIHENESKENPLDFALWKKYCEGEPYWESPFGNGRPGWHIECSAMSMKYLGDSFDIHGGGQDLIFPHHENEICQSESHTGKDFAHYWIHNGFITVQHEKMSKSLKNFKTVKDLLEVYNPNHLKFYLISTHYRSPLDFNDSLINSAKESLKKIADTISRAKVFFNEKGLEIPDDSPKVPQSFLEALYDDFNTPKALSVLFETVQELNIQLTQAQSDLKSLELFSYISGMLNLLGIEAKEKEIFSVHKDKWTEQNQDIIDILIQNPKVLTNDQVSRLVGLRGHYKTNKDYKKADDIRQFLCNKGYELRDQVDVCYWQKN